MTISTGLSWIKLRKCSPNLRGMTLSGGRAISGVEQVVAGVAGYWETTYSEIAVHDHETARKYRALLARLRAGELIALPIKDPYMTPATVTATVAASAALRATTIQIAVLGVDPVEGMYFSIGDRLYAITEVTVAPGDGAAFVPWNDGQVWEDTGVWNDSGLHTSQTFTVKFQPPLRDAAASGATVDFSNLRVLSRIKSAADGDIDYDIGRFATPTLVFVETP